MPKLNNYALCSVFSFVLFSSPPRSSSKSSKESSEKMFIHGLVFRQQFWEFLTGASACVVRVFPLLMGAVLKLLESSNDARWKKNSNKSGFLPLR